MMTVSAGNTNNEFAYIAKTAYPFPKVILTVSPTAQWIAVLRMNREAISQLVQASLMALPFIAAPLPLRFEVPTQILSSRPFLTINSGQCKANVCKLRSNRKCSPIKFTNKLADSRSHRWPRNKRHFSTNRASAAFQFMSLSSREACPCESD